MDGPSTRLRVRVSPGASRSEVVGRQGAAWKVRVAAAPEGGKANQALIALLAATLGVGKSAIEIVAGHGSRDKTVAVRGLSAGDVETRFAAPTGAR